MNMTTTAAGGREQNMEPQSMDHLCEPSPSTTPMDHP